LFNSAEYKIATYPIFMERSIEISHDGGYSSLIVPDSFLLGQYFSKIRKFILDNCEIKNLLFLTFKVFVGSTVGRSIIYIFRKNSDVRLRNNNLAKVELFKSLEDFSNNRGQWYSYRQSYFSNTDLNRFKLFFAKKDYEIVIFIDKSDSTQIKTYLVGHTGVRSLIGQKNIISKEAKDKHYKRGLISSAQVIRYSLFYDGDYININPKLLNKGGWDKDVVENPKILIRQTGDGIIATIDHQKFYHLNNLHSFSPNTPKVQKFLNSLLVIINSWFLTWYYRKISLEEGRTMAQTDIETIEKLPIPEITHTIKDVLDRMSDYLLFLNATEERRQKLKDTIEYFDHQIADSLVYELYFKEKFAEDGLYPAPKWYLAEALTEHLQPISYERWARLYWKRELEGDLTPDEERELETLERENMKTIKKVYRALVGNREVQAWIEKIKGHEWVRVVEGVK